MSKKIKFPVKNYGIFIDLVNLFKFLASNSCVPLWAIDLYFLQIPSK